MIDADAGRAFLASAELPLAGAVTPDPDAVLAERTSAYRFAVTPVPLAELPRWHLGDELVHETGRFFGVGGVAVTTDFGRTPRWDQPMILQPEIGILGFLAQKKAGALHLLAQAKMEPGNRTMVQFSPTVQATPSNYLRVHGGRGQPFLERFLGPTRGRVLVDLLLSEQGTRYYRKRNRNMIVEVPESEELAAGPDFAWLSLAQIRALLAAGERLNMNARTVLSTIGFQGAPAPGGDEFRRALLQSQLAGNDDDLGHALGWLADLKSAYRLETRRVPLGALQGWTADGESIRRADGRFFRVIGVAVEAGNREIGSWMQPMFAPTQPGFVLVVCQRRAGVMELLVQARVEPGFIDGVEICATLQCSPGNFARTADLPPFADYLDCPPSWLRLRARQSEDGGRFYHDDTTHVVVELPEDERPDLPPNYRWMRLGLIRRVMRRGYTVAIEARSLLACLQ